MVIEGHLALGRAMEAPIALRSVLMTPSRARSLGGIIERIPDGVPLYTAERDVLAELTGFDVHRGVLACATRPAPTPVATLIEGSRRLVALEGLGDLENVGSVFRVATGLGIDGVLADRRCADPLHRRCIRVSLGWSTVLPHARVPELTGALTTMTEAGFTTVALTPAGDSTPVDRAAATGILDDPFALLVGTEGSGLEPGTIAAADHRVRIPMVRGTDSMNAATALAVVASFAASARGWV